MRIVLLLLYEVNRSLLTLFLRGVAILCHANVYQNVMMSRSWCAKMKIQDHGFYSAVTLVSWSWKTKIVLFGPGLCWQWKTIPSPILAVAFSMLFDVIPEMVIWPMDWIELVLCVIICIMSCRSSSYFVCISKILFESSVQEYQVVFYRYDLIFMLIL